MVDGRFPLRRLLGVSQNSAVFLTDLPNQRPSEAAPEAAIKLIAEDPETSERQLQLWKAAAALSHAGLLRILHFGRSAVDGSPCLFVVLELASENLGELLTHRALTPEEAAGMMAPVLATLDFLHEKGLVHGAIRPSNILAVRDAIKLSPDRIVRAGEPASSWPLAAPYAPPESLVSPASDVWSLGISLYETLTQYLPNHDSNGNYVLPQLPSPFAEVIRGALVPDPAERIPLDDIRAALDPSYVPKAKPKPAAVPAPEDLVAAVTTPVNAEPEVAASETARAAAAAQASAGAAASRAVREAPGADPLAVPLSPVSPSVERRKASSHIPVSSLPNVNVTIAAPRRAPERQGSGGSIKYFIIGAASTLALAALIVPKMLRTTGNTSASPTPAATATRSSSSSAPPVAAAPAVPDGTEPVPSKPSDFETARGRRAPSKPPSSPSSTPAPLSKPPAAPPRSIEPGNPGALEVVHQVIPDVSSQARSTIRGTVRINVRVRLNPNGTVASADLNSPASSQFFANIALNAAREWQFAPTTNSSAILRFDFTNSGSKAYMVP
jgi:TonB family protein